MCRQREPFGNAARATRRVSSGTEGGSCGCSDMGWSSAENPAGCYFEERFGYACRLQKKERSKRLIIDSVTSHYCRRRPWRESMLRPGAAPEFATSINDGRAGDGPAIRQVAEHQEAEAGDPKQLAVEE